MAEKNENSYLGENRGFILSNRFQEQCFLVRNLETFQAKHKNAIFKNLVQIEDEPGMVLNLLLGKGNTSFINILPHQLSLLTPKIRIYKIFQDKNGDTQEEEMVFPTFTSTQELDQILQNKASRGDGAGIKSFSWFDNGTNPADTGFSFTAKLEMYFQSVKAFFSQQEKASGRSVSYADLISYPKTRKLRDDLYNENYFTIKAEVGWALPPDNELTLSPGLKEAISQTTTTFILNLMQHEIEFKENGEMNVSAQYIASIEGKMFSPDADIFYVKNRPKIDNVKQIDAEIKQATDFLNETRKKITDKPDNDELKNTLTLGEKALNDLINLKEKTLKEDRTKLYNRLLQKLQDRSQIYFVDVPCEEVGIGENGLLSEEELVKKNTEQNISRSYTQGVSTSNNILSNEVVERFQEAQRLKSEKELEILTEQQEKLTNSTISPLDQNKIRVNYFYFGDLIDASLDSIYDQTDENNISSIQSKKEDFRILLGSLEFFSPHSNKRIRISLADIPISLNLYNSWFIDVVIRPLRNKFSVKEFINNICSKLILRCLNPVCFGSNFVNENVFTVNSAFTLSGNYPELDPKNNSRINIKTIKNKSKNKDISLIKNYLFIGIGGYDMSHNPPNKIEDEKSGLYHFYVGSNKGLLKNVSFTRVNVPYLREMAISEASTGREGDVIKSEPYNAKVVMVGNAFFKPGMKIFIDPLSLGFGTQVPTDSLRIGGYYDVIRVENFIAPGKFETILDCTAQNILPSKTSSNYQNKTKKINSKI
ncbi:MAG: hypothetical protein HC875_19790 [Anaerolineales bacterium]|nr:hypothetical protein [Anaerolineales bacterium]